MIAPTVKPAMKRSKKRVYKMAAGILGIRAPAINGPHSKNSPMSSVGTPMLTVFRAELEMKARA